jgi:hypothetical protein
MRDFSRKFGKTRISISENGKISIKEIIHML